MSQVRLIAFTQPIELEGVQTGEELADEAMDEAVTYLVQRGLARLHEAGDGWLVILETDE